MTWDWHFFLRNVDGSHNYLQWMVSAWGWTLAVAACAFLVALVVGLAVGVARTTPLRALAAAAEAWTELFRNIPLLVQVFAWYYVLPALVPALDAVPGFALVTLALGCFTSARLSEQVCAGIRALPPGQRHAALALGLTLPQAYAQVLLPMALRLVFPTLTSEAMNIVKNSSVAFAVSIADLTMFAMQAQEETGRGIEIYLAVTGLYFFTAFAVNRAALRLERHLGVPGLAGAGR